MSMCKKVFQIALVGLFMVLTGHVCSAQQAATGKFGVVDLQRCLSESKVGKKYKAEFSVKAEQAKADLEKKEAVLKELRESLEKQSLVLSSSAKAEKEKEYQGKVEAFKEQFKAAQQNLQRQDQEITGRVMKDLQSIIKEIGEAAGYTVIAERQEGGVLYFAKEADVTDEVIRRYDQRAKD
jgi:outer membrane protein